MDAMIPIYPFNNLIETGLRSLFILTASYPNSFDLDYLVCLDYICVHSGDIDKEMPSLHPATPNRNGEIYVRRAIIEQGLNLFTNKHLIHKLYLESGIEYCATESASPFVDNLNSIYSKSLQIRSRWIKNTIISKTKTELEQIIKRQSSDFVFQLLS